LYNLVLVQDTEAGLALSWEVLCRSSDNGLLKPMLEKTRAQVGPCFKEVLADGAFVSIAELLWCENEEIKVYAPPSKDKATQAASGTAGSVKGQAHKPAQFAKEAFRYDPHEKSYICPQGKRLKEAFRTSEKRQNGLALPVIVHRASGQDCQGCVEQPRCTSNPHKGRVVKRYEGEETLERLQQRMSEPANRQVYKLRGQSVELGYADLKEHRGLRVFRCFGRQRARAQAGLVLLASNGLKILASLHRRQNAHQAAEPPEKQAG
jgi:Transposase DDE domain